MTFVRPDGQLNIPRTNTDPSYRYHVPHLETKVIGRGINIRTTLLNLTEIAKVIYLTPEYVLKFIAYEFSAKTTIERDSKTGKVSLISINGTYTTADILSCLDKFYDMYILCSNNKYAELVIHVEGKEVIGICDSCGKRNVFDQTHKMTKYFRNNPPDDLKKLTRVGTVDDEKVIKKMKIAQAMLKYEIRDLIQAADNFDMRDEKNDEILAKIKVYLGQQVELEREDYEFIDSNAEQLYKSLKRLRLKNLNYDRVGWLAFNFLFDENIVNQAKTELIQLYEQFLEKHQLKEYITLEILLNLGYLCLEKTEGDKFYKYIPTILQLFMGNEVLDEEQLKKWGKQDEEFMTLMKKHHMYKAETDDKLRELSSKFLEYIDQESDDESGSQTGSEDDDN